MATTSTATHPRTANWTDFAAFSRILEEQTFIFSFRSRRPTLQESAGPAPLMRQFSCISSLRLSFAWATFVIGALAGVAPFALRVIIPQHMDWNSLSSQSLFQVPGSPSIIDNRTNGDEAVNYTVNVISYRLNLLIAGLYLRNFMTTKQWFTWWIFNSFLQWFNGKSSTYLYI